MLIRNTMEVVFADSLSASDRPLNFLKCPWKNPIIKIIIQPIAADSVGVKIPVYIPPNIVKATSMIGHEALIAFTLSPGDITVISFCLFTISGFLLHLRYIYSENKIG